MEHPSLSSQSYVIWCYFYHDGYNLLVRLNIPTPILFITLTNTPRV